MDDVVTSIYSALDEEKSTMSSCTISNAIHVHAVSEEVVHLNDKAVACMLKNDFNTALQTLQVALARIMSLQQTQAQHPSIILPSNDTTNSHSPIGSIQLPASAGKPDGIFVVFNRALLLSHNCEFYLNCPKNQSRVLATLLYNVGLCYHLEAIQRGNSSAIFAHALSYYGWSYYVIETSSQQHGFQDILLLLLALFNNMGHIHSSQHIDGDKTRQCLRWMQSTFANPKIKTVLFPEEYEFFVQYISVPALQQLQLAPAA